MHRSGLKSNNSPTGATSQSSKRHSDHRGNNSSSYGVHQVNVANGGSDQTGSYPSLNHGGAPSAQTRGSKGNVITLDRAII